MRVDVRVRICVVIHIAACYGVEPHGGEYYDGSKPMTMMDGLVAMGVHDGEGSGAW